MTTDEQRALELADLLHTAYEAELEHEHGIEHMAAFLLPLIRDQGRWRAMRELLVAVDWNYGDPPMAIAAFRLHADRVMAGPAGADAIADAAIDKTRGET
jgi:hypothetical protein